MLLVGLIDGEKSRIIYRVIVGLTITATLADCVIAGGGKNLLFPMAKTFIGLLSSYRTSTWVSST